MEEIAIVRKRSSVWTVVLLLLLLAVIALAVLWLAGGEGRSDIGWNEVIELGRRTINGTA
jgi:ABC-type transporter Mla subunit MlaD